MTLARTLVEAAGYALSLAGRSRDHLPVPWTASAVMDDCAAFCSHVLWDGKPGPILWVDNFKTAGDGSYAPGSGDLEPWDVLLFDWDGNGVGNHVEFFVSRDPDPRYVRTFGANGADTRAAAYRRRPVSYILGRFRPRWAPAAPDNRPSPLLEKIMANADSYTRYKKKGTTQTCLVGPGLALDITTSTMRKTGLGANGSIAVFDRDEVKLVELEPRDYDERRIVWKIVAKAQGK